MDADCVLVARLLAGDDSALSDIYDRYSGLVMCIARRVLANASLAEDVVQEVFASLWEHPQRFDPQRGSLRAYLGVQAHRRAVDQIRADTRRHSREERSDRLSGCREEPDAEDSLLVAQLVHQAIARLPAAQRQAVELAVSGGQPHREVAALLGVPEGTVKSRLRLAHAKLAQWLAPLDPGMDT